MRAHHSHENKKMNDTKIALLEQSIMHINETLTRMDKRFDKIDERFDKIDEKFERVDARFDKVDTKIWSLFLWTIAGFASVLALIAHTQDWI